MQLFGITKLMFVFYLIFILFIFLCSRNYSPKYGGCLSMQVVLRFGSHLDLAVLHVLQWILKIREIRISLGNLQIFQLKSADSSESRLKIHGFHKINTFYQRKIHQI